MMVQWFSSSSQQEQVVCVVMRGVFLLLLGRDGVSDDSCCVLLLLSFCPIVAALFWYSSYVMCGACVLWIDYSIVYALLRVCIYEGLFD
jgi:hypothetical protein